MNNIQIEKINSSIGKAVLIAIGINSNNDEETFPRLTKCVKDAEGIYDVFYNQPQLNFDSSRSRILAMKNKTTKENIIKTVKIVCETVGNNDNVIFFYSGHGHRFFDDDRYYIVPTDNADSCKESLICFEDLWEIILETKAKIKLALLDSCYSGSSKLLKKDTANYSYQRDYINETKGIAIISSSSADEPSNEQSNNTDYSLFTTFLINAFKGSQEAVQDGYLSIISLFNYIDKELKKKSREYVNIKQTPNLSMIGNSKLFLGYYNNLDIYLDSIDFKNSCKINFKLDEDILDYANSNMQVLLTDQMWKDTQKLLNEIIYNVCKYSRARSCFLEISSTVIRIADNGKMFNCIEKLSSTDYKKEKNKNNGSRIYQEYAEKYHNEIKISYKYENKLNNFEIKFNKYRAFDIETTCMIKTINLNHVGVLNKNIIIPRGICEVYYYHLSSLSPCISRDFEIIKKIRNKIPKMSTLVVINENNSWSKDDISHNTIDGVIYR